MALSGMMVDLPEVPHIHGLATFTYIEVLGFVLGLRAVIDARAGPHDRRARQGAVVALRAGHAGAALASRFIPRFIGVVLAHPALVLAGFADHGRIDRPQAS
jgi:hypothetical protein